MEKVFCLPIQFGTPEFDEALQLRYDILRKPLGRIYTPEQIAAEWSEYHLACFAANHQILGYLNLSPLSGQIVKMRQVAVAADQQGRGLGSVLVRFAEEFAATLGYEKMSLHARLTAVPFYLKNGYDQVGDEFEEVGIPHYKMEKVLCKN